MRCDPTELRRLERVAIYHKVKALRRFQERFLSGTLSQFVLGPHDTKTETDIMVVLACSLIFCILCLFDHFCSSYAFPSSSSSLAVISPLFPQDNLHSIERSWLVRWLSIYSGARCIAIIVWFGFHLASGEKLPSSIPPPFFLRRFPAWGILPKQLIPLILQLTNRELSEEGITIDSKRKEVLKMPPFHAAVTNEINRMAIEDIDAIFGALFGLSKVYEMIRSDAVSVDKMAMYFIIGPLFLDDKFMHLVIEKNRVALVTLVHISALLGVLFSEDHGSCKSADSWSYRWWSKGCIPEKLKEETEYFLGYLGQECQELVTWVIEFHKMVWQNQDKDPFINGYHQPELKMGFGIDDLPELVGATCVKVGKLYTPAEERYRIKTAHFDFYDSMMKRKLLYRPASGLGGILAKVVEEFMRLDM